MALLELINKYKTSSELAELFRKRLLGDDLGYPYLIDQGESPEKAIVEAWKELHRTGDAAFIRHFDEALFSLVREAESVFVSTNSSPLNFGLTAEKLASDNRVHHLLSSPYLLYCFRLCNVAVQTGLPQDKGYFVSWAVWWTPKFGPPVK